MQKARAAKQGKKPTNVREYLNTAAELADALIERLQPAMDASETGALDRDTRETFKLALEVLKTTRELQLKSKALDHAIRTANREAQEGGPLASLPALNNIESSKLIEIVTKGQKKE